MLKYTSFVNEHSVEYVLVPQLVQLLEKNFKKVIPLYFWATREGGNMAKDSLRHHYFKMLAIYPRRPKIADINGDHILLNLNEVLFERSREFKKRGVPVIAGTLLIDSLYKFQLNAQCLWLKLNETGSQQTLEINLTNPLITSPDVNVLRPNDFKFLIDEHCNSMSGEEIIDIMRSAKSRFEEGFWAGLYGDLYKPFYVLIEA